MKQNQQITNSYVGNIHLQYLVVSFFILSNFEAQTEFYEIAQKK